MYGVLYVEDRAYILPKSSYDAVVLSIKGNAISGGLPTVGESAIREAEKLERHRRANRVTEHVAEGFRARRRAAKAAKALRKEEKNRKRGGG